MSRLRDRFVPPRQVMAVFLVLAIVSAATLGGLAWQILRQDRDLEAQRQRTRLEQEVDSAVVSMQRALGDLQALISAGGGAGVKDPPAGVTLVEVSTARVSVRPTGALLFVPDATAASSSVSSRIFADGERLDLQGNAVAAAAAYAALSRSPDPVVRAGALLRGAHVARRRGQTDAALALYQDLFDLDGVRTDGYPAGLAARLGRLTTFTTAGRDAERRAEALALVADLGAGRWLISRAMYDMGRNAAREVLDADLPVDDPAARARAEVVSRTLAVAEQPMDRRLEVADNEPMLVMSSPALDGVTILIADQRYLETLASEALPPDVDWTIGDVSGRPVLGSGSPPANAVSRTAAVMGLPWTLQVFPPFDVAPAASPIRSLLLAALTLVTLVMLSGWYVIFRALVRERQTAQLQSDFVAAVSHEFRSPLTSVGHIAELLAQDRIASDQMRRESYDVLVRDAGRLRTLVEGLLDFGRFESGEAVFRREPTDLGEVVKAVVADAAEQAAADGYRVTLTGQLEGIHVDGDREALGRALRNLLDNAIKYSPDERTVEVDVQADDQRVSVAVSDRGLGIPPAEQARIFDRFVRGGDAKARRIRGTGIGLAMVRQIARAHDGDVRVESEPGRGSTFTLDLPILSRESRPWREYSSSKTKPALPSA